jgi:hypothetical protein
MNIPIMALGGAGGALATFVLQRYGVSAVIASSLVGLVGAFIGFLVSDTYLPAAIFAGSFVGMTALTLGSIPVIVTAGLGAGLLFALIISKNIFPGYGGRLGSVAFIATSVVLLVSKFWVK